MPTNSGHGPVLFKGAFVSVPAQGGPPQATTFQYNPEALRRELQSEMVGGEQGDRTQAVRFKGPPVETISLDLELNAADALDRGDATAQQLGVYPQLAALEVLAYPSIDQVKQRESLLNSGTLEITPMTAPLVLFVWGAQRVLPVRLEGYSVNEEEFDPNLNPIRATVSVRMRVLTYADLVSDNPGYNQFMAYQRGLETIAAQGRGNPQSTGVNISQL